MDLVGDGPWTVGGGKPSRLGGVRGGTEGVRAHVGNGCGLPGCFRGSRRWRSGSLACGGASGEATPDFSCDIELAAGKGLRSSDGIAGTRITRSFRFEQPQNALCAVRRPPGDDPPVGLAQCLRRAYPLILPGTPNRRPGGRSATSSWRRVFQGPLKVANRSASSKITSRPICSTPGTTVTGGFRRAERRTEATAALMALWERLLAE